MDELELVNRTIDAILGRGGRTRVEMPSLMRCFTCDYAEPAGTEACVPCPCCGGVMA